MALVGCTSPTITVTVPRIERLQLRTPDTPELQIDRALSERAEAYARERNYAQAWRGAGLSMEPLIPPDAWIVTETIPFEALEKGQVVLYLRSHGRRVAHALVRRTGQGWITVGINNEQIADDARVTRRNYIGVVTAAFIVEQ
ncbi:MAG: hypothetical protein SynsKO_18610 [Synoicihabitans sp.]